MGKTVRNQVSKMAVGKTLEELRLEKQLKELLAAERAAKRAAARKLNPQEYQFEIKKDDLVKGIVLREILGPPKAFE